MNGNVILIDLSNCKVASWKLLSYNNDSDEEKVTNHVDYNNDSIKEVAMQQSIFQAKIVLELLAVDIRLHSKSIGQTSDTTFDLLFNGVGKNPCVDVVIVKQKAS
jgi:hypothetical protein